MDENNLYVSEIIEKEFSQYKLFELLKEDDFYNIEKTDVIIKKNTPFPLSQNNVEYIYYIYDGIVAVSVGDEILEFKGPSEFVGLSYDALDGSSQGFTAKSITKAKLCRFVKSEVIAKTMSTQEGYLYHYKSMLDQYGLFTHKFTTIKKTRKEQVYISLQELAEKFGRPDDRNSNSLKIPTDFSRKILANYIGIGVSKLSEILSELQRDSLITIDNKRQISVVSNREGNKLKSPEWE
ncbi:Crp/Fnr family transcriptional regulator [Listeria booriae]|uniref:Crp/Fnr family transcriptional regulator n=1 Tax=Listeria booriae TaxID=1552123 RepID=A0A842GAQ5_9LIST|nr:Crp/Fnr family transcriptional regulator [Listeria booriae]MBC2285025.1 Crp/Fnr family transcriptional regulator [Listeria booriae]MBC2292787.1 Crp/Fnr family transcriptional regulator [Listeria booriae]MBC2676168.1 Crp/Fnr family transcriptional regulator [Listeria booriae]